MWGYAGIEVYCGVWVIWAEGKRRVDGRAGVRFSDCLGTVFEKACGLD